MNAKTLGFGLLATLGLGAVFLGIAIMVGLGINNGAVDQEEGITGVYKSSMLEYDKFWKTVSETAQVPSQYKDDFREVMLAEMDARYKGKDPMLLFVEEKGASLSPELYQQVQRVIEAGRQQFTESQQVLVSRQATYKKTLRKQPNATVLSWLGFPDVICETPEECDANDYAPHADIDSDGKITVMDYKIVTSAKTVETFKTGREDAPLDVFGKGD